MQTIEIQTPQNVNIEYPIASLGDRVVATIIDLLIMIGYFIAAIFVYIWLLDLSDDLGVYYPVAYFVILYLPLFFYHLLCESFLNGQSFGKKIMKMRVVRLDGAQAGIGSYFLRWIIAPIDIYFTYGSVGLITMLINGKGQRLGDLAANTTVVKLKAQAKLDDTILQATPTEYDVIFPQVNLLSDKDIAIVKEVLDLNYKQPDAMMYERIIHTTKDAIEKKIGVNSDLHSITFLDTVLKDYNYLMSE
ncbi:MAG: RDD family protein [Ignavibacteria bacterium]|nr:RDD family protein [Ignavibacteria bacterium]MBT8382159.1 RDD family protein [Ignavibacteria bacterium]MBT8392097.1 RDD family protein [Ignavibacteria bacterium]NNL22776.1 RDD family protein [Ignavibacteriaceae bacterium]